MSGEKSKKSGEIGERLSRELLSRIGWASSLHNISIPCNTPSHVNENANRRQSHGDDSIFLYHNPFHDDRTDIVHVSVKNNLKGYPKSNLSTPFKAHVAELLETIHCASYSVELRELATTFKAKKNIVHSGLLCWLHNDLSDIERDIKPNLQGVRLESESNHPVFLVDNARAAFLLKVIDDIERRYPSAWEFYYPRTGTAVSVEEGRAGKFMPLEILGSDIVPIKVKTDRGGAVVLIYADQAFSYEAYLRLYAYGLHFANGLVSNVMIGMPDYNNAIHENDAARAKLAFSNREELVTPFSFKSTLMSLLEVKE